jgi:hypothetical protein
MLGYAAAPPRNPEIPTGVRGRHGPQSYPAAAPGRPEPWYVRKHRKVPARPPDVPLIGGFASAECAAAAQERAVLGRAEEKSKRPNRGRGHAMAIARHALCFVLGETASPRNTSTA